MRNKKIGIIGIRGLPAMYGAFDTFVDQLVRCKQAKELNMEFYVSCDKNFKLEKFHADRVKRIFISRGKGFLILLNYFFSILIMYMNGVRTFLFFGYGSAIFFPILKLFNCKVICNPDGIEWRRPEGKIKIFFFKICEILTAKLEIIRIYDSEVIKRYYNQIHGSKGCVAYYPPSFKKNLFIKKRQNSNVERFYILGRLLEENNTETIISAFLKAPKNKKLYIIGKSNLFFDKNLLPLINKKNNIFYLGPIYEREKLSKICSLCDYYIHGHSVGGTNPTLIEAISLKKGVISFKTFFNKEILKENAIYFKNAAELTAILNSGSYKQIKPAEFRDVYTADYINKIYLNLASIS